MSEFLSIAAPFILSGFVESLSPFSSKYFADQIEQQVDSEVGLDEERLKHVWIAAKWGLGANQLIIAYILTIGSGLLLVVFDGIQLAIPAIVLAGIMILSIYPDDHFRWVSKEIWYWNPVEIVGILSNVFIIVAIYVS